MARLVYLPLKGLAYLLKVLDVQGLDSVIHLQSVQHCLNMRLVGVCWHVLLQPQHSALRLKLGGVTAYHVDQAPERFILQPRYAVICNVSILGSMECQK